MFFLYTAWRYGGEHPWQLFHGPGADSPRNWRRVKLLIYGFSVYAEKQKQRELSVLATGKVAKDLMG